MLRVNGHCAAATAGTSVWPASAATSRAVTTRSVRLPPMMQEKDMGQEGGERRKEVGDSATVSGASDALSPSSYLLSPVLSREPTPVRFRRQSLRRRGSGRSG